MPLSALRWSTRAGLPRGAGAQEEPWARRGHSRGALGGSRGRTPKRQRKMPVGIPIRHTGKGLTPTSDRPALLTETEESSVCILWWPVFLLIAPCLPLSFKSIKNTIEHQRSLWISAVLLEGFASRGAHSHPHTSRAPDTPYHSILKFFQVDITGMFRMTSCARYFKAGVGSSRPNWRWIMCFVERPKTNTSCKALVKRLSLS